MRQLANESAIDCLRRIMSWVDHEYEGILTTLPTIQSIIDYALLWTVYDAEFLNGIHEAILNGADPTPFNDFVKKYKLDSWKLK